MPKIKIAIGYPPLISPKGTPLLSQNRQFQWFNNPTYIYPMIPAYAATLLKKNGYRVFWMDGIAEEQTYPQWEKQLIKNRPDYLMIETKTPVVKSHWRLINQLKKRLPDLKIILVGDHVTFLPYESFANSRVDYIIAGGDYDFVITNLLNHIHKKESLEGGVYWRSNDKNIKIKPKNKKTISKETTIYNSGAIALKHNINLLPFIDRELTKWKLYAYQNGNFKYKPGTYVYSGRDCWWGKCTFCVWNQVLWPLGSYRTFSPERLFEEVKFLVDKYGVREIFDDAGTFYIGPKLRKFCQLMINSGYNKKVAFSCNMRFKGPTQEDYYLMKKANFRFLLYGMESANQKTLDRIKKGIQVDDIVKGAQMASKAGLEVHATVMLGYPWENYQDAKKTIELAKFCFKKGYFSSLQATIIIPYPGTELWKEAKKNHWLLTENYDDYDMRGPVMKIPFPKERLLSLTQELYSSFISPQFIFRKILSIRSIDDIKFLYMAGTKLLAHLLDFDPHQTKTSFFSFIFWKDILKTLGKNLFKSKTSVDSQKNE